MEKISKDKTHLEMKCFWLSREEGERHSIKSIFDSSPDQQSKLSLKIITVEHRNLFSTLNYSLRAQVPTIILHFLRCTR